MLVSEFLYQDIYYFPALVISLLDKCYPKLPALSTITTNAIFMPGVPLALHGSQSCGKGHFSSGIWKFFLCRVAIQFGFTLDEILVTKTLHPPQLKLAFSCFPLGTAGPQSSLQLLLPDAPWSFLSPQLPILS